MLKILLKLHQEATGIKVAMLEASEARDEHGRWVSEQSFVGANEAEKAGDKEKRRTNTLTFLRKHPKVQLSDGSTVNTEYDKQSRNYFTEHYDVNGNQIGDKDYTGARVTAAISHFWKVREENNKLLNLNSRRALFAADADAPQLTQGTVDAMKDSLKRRLGKAAEGKLDAFADKARAVVESSLKTEQETREGQEQTVTVGTGTAEARTELSAFLDEAVGEDGSLTDMDFFQRIAREVALGAGKHVAANSDPVRVDEFPALELLRVYDREVPRGEKLVKGAYVPDPENSHEERWEAACEAAGDDDALEAYKSSGRMVALKDSGVWQALGDGAGGYDDALGNPFAPFWFNTGYDTEEVARADAEELGLLEEGEEAEGADVDPETLFAKYAANVVHRSLHARMMLELVQAALEAGGSASSKGCLMAMIDDTLADKLIAFTARNIPFASMTGDGLENEPHVTVLYGFNEGFDTQELKDWFKGDNGFTMTLGKVSRFECPEYDVLKLDVNSEWCVATNELLSSTFKDDVTASQYTYKAHLTLAYVEKGMCKELDGDTTFEGVQAVVKTLLYSEPGKVNRFNILLK